MGGRERSFVGRGVFSAGRRPLRLGSQGPGPVRAGERTANPTLDVYFRDTGRFPLLTAAAEGEAAHRIQRLAVEEWVAAFSCPPLLPCVLREVRRRFPEVPIGELRALLRFATLHRRRRGRLSQRHRLVFRGVATELAWKLHDLDSDHRRFEALVGFLDLRFGEECRKRPRRQVRAATFRRFRDSVESVRRARAREKDRFLSANLRLVVAVAKCFEGPALPLPDLIQEGNTGLMKAVERYDVRRGYRFATYATWWIRQAIGHAVESKGRLLEKLAARERFVLTRRFGLDGREAETLKQIGRRLGISRERVRQIELAALRRMLRWLDTSGRRNMAPVA
ncbi:MAG: sigma-70 family RNA polymerase sigma factor [Deltaproteobacteria bacterium]|nr:sigma-70 family RNA polymerase sigma factor [Deltaproteobacteria bacterium]